MNVTTNTAINFRFSGGAAFCASTDRDTPDVFVTDPPSPSEPLMLPTPAV
jgi:hypothetical protein